RRSGRRCCGDRYGGKERRCCGRIPSRPQIRLQRLSRGGRGRALRVVDVGEAEDPGPRDESEADRLDRNLGELLQELRVAGLGVQVLFGFLLSLPFTTRFTHLSPGQRNLYLGTIVLAAVATALLLGPVAYHRLVFRQGEKERLVRAANVMA